MILSNPKVSDFWIRLILSACFSLPKYVQAVQQRVHHPGTDLLISRVPHNQKMKFRSFDTASGEINNSIVMLKQKLLYTHRSKALIRLFFSSSLNSAALVSATINASSKASGSPTSSSCLFGFLTSRL